MKTAIRYGIFLASVSLLFYGAILYLFPAPCKQEIAYSVGTLDKNFGLSHEKFLTAIQNAELAWEQASGRELFVYDPNSSFTINLLYDDRQERTDRAKTITDQLEETAQSREGLQEQYDNLHTQYLKAQQAYDASVAAYERDVQNLNTDIAESNAAGGASPAEYKEFQNRQASLSARRNELELQRANVNTLASQVNKLADTENKAVKTYNKEVERLQEEFGDEGEFGQGEYSGRAITIYTFTDMQNLTQVLEHELGHALGIDHLPNPSSVMYYLVHDEGGSFAGPTSDDLAALEAQCKKTSLDVFLERL